MSKIYRQFLAGNTLSLMFMVGFLVGFYLASFLIVSSLHWCEWQQKSDPQIEEFYDSSDAQPDLTQSLPKDESKDESVDFDHEKRFPISKWFLKTDIDAEVLRQILQSYTVEESENSQSKSQMCILDGARLMKAMYALQLMLLNPVLQCSVDDMDKSMLNLTDLEYGTLFPKFMLKELNAIPLPDDFVFLCKAIKCLPYQFPLNQSSCAV